MAFAEEFPTTYAAIENEPNARLKKQANKEFLDGSSKPDLIRALCMTAAKRHCAEAKREYNGMDALLALVLKSTRDEIEADDACEDEWVRLIQFFEAGTVPPATGSFSSPRKPLVFADRFSGLVGAISAEKNDRLKKQANKEFLPSGSPNKSHLIEALLLTAAKRHCAEAKREYDGMDALLALVLKGTRDEIEADAACEDEWVALIEFFEAKYKPSPSKPSPTGVADFTPPPSQSSVKKNLSAKFDDAVGPTSIAELLAAIPTEDEREAVADALKGMLRGEDDIEYVYGVHAKTFFR
jgi:hypothetical protein